MKASELKALITKYSKIEKWNKSDVRTMANEYAQIVMKAPVENVGRLSDFKQVVNKPVAEQTEKIIAPDASANSSNNYLQKILKIKSLMKTNPSQKKNENSIGVKKNTRDYISKIGSRDKAHHKAVKDFMESPIGKSVAFNDFISSLALNSVEQNSNSLPAVDRFVNLAMQLENPSFSSSYLTNKLASELNLAYGIGSDKKNLAYNLLSDKEYMMKF